VATRNPDIHSSSTSFAGSIRLLVLVILWLSITILSVLPRSLPRCWCSRKNQTIEQRISS